jgi:hypothetical protein
VHQAPHGKVREQQPVEFLPHQVGRLAAQDDLGPAQVGLELIESCLSGKGLARC